MVDVNTDLFTVNYKSSFSASNAGKLDLTLVICPDTKTISGAGQMTLRYSDNIEVGSKIEGSFITTLICDSPRFLITAMGYQKTHWPVRSDDTTEVCPNLMMLLAIDEDWQNGVANIKYKQSGENGKN